MTNLRETLTRALLDVAALGRPWALVGGLAVSARAEPRPTRDVDLVIAANDDAQAETIVRELMRGGYDLVAALEHTATGRLATVRLRPTLAGGKGALVDLLFASSGIEAEIAQRAESLEILPGVVVPVATVADLIALKVLARDDRSRPQVTTTFGRSPGTSTSRSSTTLGRRSGSSPPAGTLANAICWQCSMRSWKTRAERSRSTPPADLLPVAVSPRVLTEPPRHPLVEQARRLERENVLGAHGTPADRKHGGGPFSSLFGGGTAPFE